MGLIKAPEDCFKINRDENVIMYSESDNLTVFCCHGGDNASISATEGYDAAQNLPVGGCSLSLLFQILGE